METKIKVITPNLTDCIPLNLFEHFELGGVMIKINNIVANNIVSVN